MKSVLSVIVLTVSVLFASAQERKADENFLLVIEGNRFHNNDTFPKALLKNICKSFPDVINLKTGQQLKPLSVKWVVSSKAGVWKGECGKGEYNVLDKAIAAMDESTIFFLDELLFEGNGKTFPTQFALKPR